MYDTSGEFPRSIEPDAVIRPESWLAEHTGPALFLGDGALAYRELIQDRLGDAARIAPAWIPDASAAAVAVWGRKRALDGDVVDPDSVSPVYLRRPQALEKS